MSAPFDELEQEGRIEPVPTGQAEVERLHVVVARDLATAEDLRERNQDWALAIAYNAVLQACVALMAAHGYRPRGEGQHWTAIEFGRLALSQHEHLFDRLDRLRQRRHRAVYSAVGQISSVEVRDALTLAGEVIPILKEAAGRVLKDRDGKGKGPNSSGGADR